VVFSFIVRSVTLAIRVEMPTRTHSVAAGTVTFFMDVKTVFGIGCKSLNLTRHEHTFSRLFECNQSSRRVSIRGRQLRGCGWCWLESGTSRKSECREYCSKGSIHEKFSESLAERGSM